MQRPSFPGLLAAGLCLFLCLLLSSAALALYPAPHQMDAVEHLADQLLEDVSALADAAQSQSRGGSAGPRGAIIAGRLQILQDRASHFSEQVYLYDKNPARTEAAYRSLRPAYEGARAALTALAASSNLRLLVRRVQATMGALYEYYEIGRPPQVIAGMTLSDLTRTADMIQSATDSAYQQALAEYTSSVPTLELDWARGVLNQIRDLDRAAKSFYARVIKYQGDPRRLAGPYLVLTRDYHQVLDGLRYFSPAVREYLLPVESLLRRLSFLSQRY